MNSRCHVSKLLDKSELSQTLFKITATRLMNSESTPTIFVVDDEQDVRDSLAELVDAMGMPVECFCSAEHFLGAVEAPRPGVVILDIRMPGMSGLELQRRLNGVAQFLVIVMVTGHGSVPLGVQAMRQGAFDFLQKPYNPSQLRKIIKEAVGHAQDRWNRWQAHLIVAKKIDLLSSREKEVCDLLVAGMQTRTIAAHLGISPSTVEKHRLKVFEKIQVESVPNLIHEVNRFILDFERSPSD